MLSDTSGVSTQAAEEQHSNSAKFRSHLAYMSPASFMAHRIAQLSLINLTAAYKIQDPDAKPENDGVRLDAFYFSHRNVTCIRKNCSCTAAAGSDTDGLETDVDDSGAGAAAVAGDANVEVPVQGVLVMMEDEVDSRDSEPRRTAGGGGADQSPACSSGSGASGGELGQSPALGSGTAATGDAAMMDTDVFMEE